MKKKISDAELIQGIKSSGAKRQQFMAILYERHFDFVYAGKKRYSLSFEQAHDAYGDVIIKACSYIQKDDFVLNGKLSSYIFRAFCNRCVDKIRRNASLIMQEDIADHYDLPTPAKNILEELELGERWLQLDAALDSIGEKCKNLLLDIEYLGYSLEEVAQRRGYSKAATVANIKYRCMKRLRELLQLDKPKKS